HIISCSSSAVLVPLSLHDALPILAHVSGGIMAAYIAFGIEAKHLLAAVIMTAPGTLLMAKMLVPETERSLTAGRVEMPEMEKERSEEHTSELQSLAYLVCRLLLEK